MARAAGERSLDELQHHAALDLSPPQQEEFQRLAKTLRNARGFRLLFAEVNTAADRERVRPAMTQLLTGMTEAVRVHHVVDLDAADAPDNFEALERRLTALAAPDALIEFINGNSWLWISEQDNRLSAFNVRRDALARECPALHLWWVSTATLQHIATHAHDLWSWRSGVFDFRGEVAAPQSDDLRSGWRSGIEGDQRHAALGERARRIGALTAMLADTSDAETRWPLLYELSELNQSIGELARALKASEEAVRMAEALPEGEREKALALGQTADVLYARGELDEALRIRREEELPVYEKLGNVRARAMTLGKIADVLSDQGELDEALRMLRDEVLPAFEKLSDVRSRAVTLGQIADVLSARGELDEALRIRREEQLPVYEKLGDVRARAVTLGKIADVLSARGELDEALRILRDELLPVFEKLGDVRSRAMTLGGIADVLHERGELDEALRTRREEELPVYEKLGDVRSTLVCRANTAIYLNKRRRRGDVDAARALLKRALGDAERLRIPEAGQIRGLLKQLGKG